jgi:predicted Fe-S protein YdhL (DUF1289 family)
VKKELRPVHDVVNCDVCGRTILKGERAEWYLAPGGHRHQVCDLCAVRAQAHGWIRESATGEMPARPARSDKGRGLGRLMRRRPASEPAQEQSGEGAFAEREALYGATDTGEQDASGEDSGGARDRQRSRTRPKDPRHVRAVPTTAEVKVDRAIELFNGSSHARTVAGLARTLGPAWVSAQPDSAQPSTVVVLVAWELSWYRYRVDLGDEADPVMMLDKGEELEQIDPSLRNWNAGLDAEGRLVPALAGEGGSDE